MMATGCINRFSAKIGRLIKLEDNKQLTLMNKSFTPFDPHYYPSKSQSRYLYRVLHKLKIQIGTQAHLTDYKGRIKTD